MYMHRVLVWHGDAAGPRQWQMAGRLWREHTEPFLPSSSLHVALECWWRHAATSGHHAHAHGHAHGHGHSSNATKLSRSASAGLAGNAHAHSGTATSSDAVLCGLEAGACFGFSAAACRTGVVLGS